MLIAALALGMALAVCALPYALATRGVRRLDRRIKRAAAAYEELETHCVALGAGLGIGA